MMRQGRRRLYMLLAATRMALFAGQGFAMMREVTTTKLLPGRISYAITAAHDGLMTGWRATAAAKLRLLVGRHASFLASSARLRPRK